MHPAILHKRDETINLIVEKLGKTPTDFCQKLDFIKNKRRRNEPWQAAGVLLLLFYRKSDSTAANHHGEFVFQLIKRSALVPQGGDLSCPGGILEMQKDRLLCRFVSQGFPPMMKGDARSYAREQGHRNYQHISLFLANAARESWEEVRLSPFNIHFLGSLPCYDLTLFTKTIFPLVGLVKKGKKFSLNGGEVDKIVEIPLTSFFYNENYAWYSLEASAALDPTIERQWDFPCLIHDDQDGNTEILWGATFNIIMSFLRIVFDFELPHISPDKIIKRILYPEYLTGDASP